MSTFERLFSGIRQLLVMREEVARLTADVARGQDADRDHERRLVRIETLIEVGMNQPPPAPRRLPRR